MQFIPVYAGSRELVKRLTGYPLTRIVLFAMQRPPLPSVEEVLKGARRIVVIDNVMGTEGSGLTQRCGSRCRSVLGTETKMNDELKRQDCPYI